MIRHLARCALIAVFVAGAGHVVPTTGGRQQPLPRTWQEEPKFRAGPTPFEPLMTFWYELDRMSDLVSIRPLTRTLLDRELTLVAIAKDPVGSPQDAIRAGKTIVLIATSIAKVVPLLLDHGITVHRFTGPATLELEVYEATGVQRNEYFQGHYLEAVTGVEKKTEKVDVPVGWYYVNTAQPKGNPISYILEPETDDNLITWGYADSVLRVTPDSVEDAMEGLLGEPSWRRAPRI